LLHLEHEASDQWLQIRILDRIFSRDNEAELVAVITASIEETRSLRAIPLGVIQGPWLSFSRNTIALQVSQVGLCATSAGWRQAYQPRFNDDAPAPWCHGAVLPPYDSADTGAPTNAATVKFALAARSCLAKPACTPEGCLDLSKECSPSKRARSDSAQPGFEVFVVLHEPPVSLVPSIRRLSAA
jgi:hypothetical protein